MPVDRLTKVLPCLKHKSFIKQLGLKDIRSLIALQENKEEEKRVKLLA
jgi:hypothetical protein